MHRISARPILPLLIIIIIHVAGIIHFGQTFSFKSSQLHIDFIKRGMHNKAEYAAEDEFKRQQSTTMPLVFTHSSLNHTSCWLWK